MKKSSAALYHTLTPFPGDLVSIAGAGGKTTTALRLMDELARAGRRMVFTTTTKIMEPIPQPGERLVLAKRLDTARRALAHPSCARLFLAQYRLPETDSDFAASAPYPAQANKLAGLAPEWIDTLAAEFPETTFLVEADGARHRLLKAPAHHEPVIPAATTLLIPMANLAALDKPLTVEYIHRPELLAQLLDVSLGEIITPKLVISALAHPQGGLKRAPESARIVPLLTWWRAAPLPRAAIETADRLAAQPGIERVIVTHPAAKQAVRYATPPAHVSAIVLAAGASRRMGRPKQLLPWGPTGQPMLRHVIQQILAAQVDEVIVVLGHTAERIAPMLQDLPVRVIINPIWTNGLSTSLRAGLDALPANADAALFIPADQPHLTPPAIAALVARFRRTRAPIIVPRTKHPRGAPAIFARALFGELAAVRGDRGGRDLITRYSKEAIAVDMPDPALLADIDTPDDYASFNIEQS